MNKPEQSDEGFVLRMKSNSKLLHFCLYLKFRKVKTQNNKKLINVISFQFRSI